MYKGYAAGMIGHGGRSIEDDISLAVKNGYEGIILNISADSNRDPHELKELLEKNNLKNGGFGFPFNFRLTNEVFEEGMKTLPALCDFAAKTGTDRCCTWIMPAHDELDFKENFELHKTRLSKAAKVLEDYGIRFGLEFVGSPDIRKTKKYKFIYNLESMIELLDAIGTSNMGFLLDVFHWDTAGQTFSDFAKIRPEQVVMAHINDAPEGIPMDEQKDGKRELPGATGVLRIGEFFKGLQSLKYDGPVYVEPFYEPLKTMTVDEAVKTTKIAMDKVWPR